MINNGFRMHGIMTAEKACGWLIGSLLLLLTVEAAHGQAVPGQAAPGQTATTQATQVQPVQVQAAPETQATQAPTASANIDEVSLDIVVHDKRHRAVTDLKAEDLAVTDNDAPVKLKDFHLVSGDSGTDHAVTLVFDRFHGTTAKSALGIADKILKALPSKGYSFALFDIAGRLRMLQSFTSDRDAIRQAVKVETESTAADKTPEVELEATNLTVGRTATKPGPDAERVAQAEKDLIAIAGTGADAAGKHVDVETRARCQVLLSALEGAPQIQQDQHTSPQLAGVLSLVRSQQKLASRKALIYFTQNAQMDSAAKEMLHTIVGAANQAGVSIYVVDMNSLDVGGKYQIDNAIGSQNVAFNPSAQPVPGSQGHASQVPSEEMAPSGPTTTVGMAVDWNRQSSHPFTEIKSPMADLARDTGGAYMDAQDSIKKPLQQMVDDLSTYYQASYVPPIEQYDGSFRTIEAKPLRTGLDIRTKTGYFAVASGSGVRPFEAPLLKALSLPQLPTDLKFHAAVLQFGQLPDGNTSAVAVEVPIAALQARKDARTGLFSAHVAIVAEIKDNNGMVVEHFSEDISRRGALENIDNNNAEDITLNRHFMAIPGRYTLEVAALDRLGNVTGAQRIPFEIPSVQTTPSLSEMVLVGKVDAIHDEDDPQEPLRYEKGKITPNLSGDVPEHAKSVSLFFILHPDPKSKDPVTLQMSASRNGHPGKLMTLPLHMENAGATVPYMASFKSGLAPGDYDVKATISQGGRTDVRSLTFTVEGGESVASEVAKSGPQAHSDGADGISAGDVSVPASGELAITPITDPVARPSAADAQQLIEDARTRAVNYGDSLPNFLCVEVTNRSFDPSGSGRWRHRDTVAELLRYRDKIETHTMLEIDGKASSVDRSAMSGKQGAFSAGELGGVLTSVFAPKSKTDFEWKETDALGNGKVQVFNYHVAQSNSVFSVVGMNDREVMVAFHGLVFIDSATHNVRRISMIADDLPRDFPTHYTSITVDYDYVAINSHDYLMPVSAQMRLRQGRHDDILNTIEFRDYRRFGSNVRIVEGYTPVEKQ